MREEKLDIFDQTGRHIGVEARSEVHRLGLWHQTFHCWIYQKKGQEIQLLFQKRHPEKDTCPNLLDITSAGHLLAGEEPRDGVRELEEELGVTVSFEQLYKIGMIKDITSAPGIVDKELCHVFAFECEQPLHLYRLQQEEVTGLFWVRLDEVERLFAGEALTAVASGFWIQEDGFSHEEILEVAKAAFVPHEEHYYRQVFAAIKQLASITNGI